MIRLKIDNSYASAVKTGKWKNPGARFYDKLLDAMDWKGNSPVHVEDLTTGTMDYLKEAYLIVGKVANSPYERTPFSRSGCKYPHHTIKNGRLVVSIPGLRAAYARAKQMGEFKGEIKKHLIRHYKEMRIFTDSMMESDMRIDENFQKIESFLEQKELDHFEDPHKYSRGYMKESTGDPYNYDIMDDDDEEDWEDEIYNESVEYLTEASHGKLKVDHRLAIDVNTHHQLHIVYSMDGIKINHSFVSPEEEKKIRKLGNVNHSSSGQKVLAIIDLKTGEKLQECECIGPMSDTPHGPPIKLKVGEIDHTTTWKSTFWPKGGSVWDRADGSLPAKIARTEPLGAARGIKIHNWDPIDQTSEYNSGKPSPGSHPDKRRYTNSRDPKIKAIENQIREWVSTVRELEQKLPGYHKSLEKETDPELQEWYQELIDGQQKRIKQYRDLIDDLCHQIGITSEDAFRDNTIIQESVEDLSNWIDHFVHSDSFREAADTSNPMLLKTPEELCEWMKQHIDYGWIPQHPLNVVKQLFQYMQESFTYGLYDKSLGRRRMHSTAEDWVKYQVLQSPSELERSRVGVCWDFATYEANYLKQRIPDIQMKCYYAQFFNQDETKSVEDPTHTFVVFQWNDKWYYIEVAFTAIAGIYTADHVMDIINYVMKQMATYHDHNLFEEGYGYDVWEYDALDPKLIGLHCQEYMQYVMDHGTCLNYEFKDEGSIIKFTDLEPTVFGTGDGDDEDLFFQYYRLQSPQQLIQSGVGVCWDTVRLEGAWLKGHRIPYKIYYMEINDGENCPSHTFTVFQEDGQFHMIDRSAGWVIKSFRTINELYYTVQHDFRRDHNDTQNPLFIKILPEVSTGMTCEEYMNRAHEGETVYGEEDLYQESANLMYVYLPIYMIKAEVYAVDGVEGILYTLCTHGNSASRLLVQNNGFGMYAFTKPEYRNQGFMEYLIRWCVLHTQLRQMNVSGNNKPMILLLDKIGFKPTGQTTVDEENIITLQIDPDMMDPVRENVWRVDDQWLSRNGYDPVLGTIYRNGNRFCCTIQASMEKEDPMEIVKKTFESTDLLFRIEWNGKNVYSAYAENCSQNELETLLIEGETYIPMTEGALYFTPDGYEHFFEYVWPIMKPNLGEVEVFTCTSIPGTILESDQYHIIVEDPMKIEEMRAIERRIGVGRAVHQNGSTKVMTESATEKNGVRRQKLYEAFRSWAWEQNEKNTFSQAFDKDTFNTTYPFVPEDMRYFYRWANPMLCVVKDNMCWFQLSELRKVNQDVNLKQLMIFASSEDEQLVFNHEDGGIYRAAIENDEIELQEKLGDNFDEWLQSYIGAGDILHMSDEDLEKEKRVYFKK